MTDTTCPGAIDGAGTLNANVDAAAALAVALITPHELIFDEHTVIAAEPLVLAAYRFTVLPFNDACTALEFELLTTEYVPVPPATMMGTFWPYPTVTLFWLNVMGCVFTLCTVTVKVAQFVVFASEQTETEVDPLTFAVIPI